MAKTDAQRRYSFRILSAGHIRREDRDGREFVIVPVVATRAGVRNGELLPADELAKAAQAFEGVPLLIHHPRIGGEPALAHEHPEVMAQAVGAFENVTFEIDKIKGEMALDVQKIHDQGGDAELALQKINDGELEVSIGFTAKVDAKNEGTFEGESYSGALSDIRPDHLALLPKSTGACSWRDGCGAPRINESESMDKKTFTEWITEWWEGVKVHAKKKDDVLLHGESLSRVLGKMIDDQAGANRSRTAIIQDLAREAGIATTKINEILEGDVDFPKRRWLDAFASVLNVDMWDLIFAADRDAGKVARGGDVPEFFEDESGETGAGDRNRAKTDDPKPEGEKPMKELIDRIIAHEGTQFTEEDREFLGSQEEKVLEKFLPVEKEEPKEHEADCSCKECSKEDPPEKLEDYIENVPDPEARAFLANGVREMRERRQNAVKTLVEGKYPIGKEKLENPDIFSLEELENLVKQQSRNYSAANPGGILGDTPKDRTKRRRTLLAKTGE